MLSFQRRGTRARLIALCCAAFLSVAMQAGAAGEVKNPSNQGQLKEVAFKELKKSFADPDRIYAPFMFWFWDEALNPDKMATCKSLGCSAQLRCSGMLTHETEETRTRYREERLK